MNGEPCGDRETPDPIGTVPGSPALVRCAGRCRRWVRRFFGETALVYCHECVYEPEGAETFILTLTRQRDTVVS